MAALAAVALAGACGRSQAGDPMPNSSPPAHAVTIDTFAFTPKVSKVRVGDTVTWTNNDDILHTVSSGTRDYDPTNGGEVTATHKDGAFDMKLDGAGSTARFAFTERGTYHYFCDRHPGMEADIEVG